MSKTIIKKFEIFVFMFCLFFQNFSVFYTKDFGIAALTAFLIYISIKNKYYLNINRKYTFTVIFIVIIIILSSIINNIFNIMQIIRLLMIFFIIYSTYCYISDIHKNKLINYFYKIFLSFVVIFTIYGFYELIAVKYNLPLIFNFFSNNPSYGARGLFEGYGGWSNTNRIYTAFFEPAVYGTFLVNSLFFINTFKIKNKYKVFVNILIILNILLTFARSAWILLLFYFICFIFFKYFYNQKILKKMGEICIVIFPFIAFAMMIILGLKLFDDLSSLGRTYSSIYYFNNSFESIKSFFFGHGYGSILLRKDPIYISNVLIERYAHNGYIEIIYQLGWPFLVVLLIHLKKIVDKNVTNNKYLVYAAIFSLSSFGILFSVESIICLVVIIYSCCCLNKSDKKENKNKKLKILFVNNDSSNYGSSKSMVNLASALKKYDIDIKVLIPKKGSLEELLKAKNIDYKISRYFSWINEINNRPPIIKIALKRFLNRIKAIIISEWVRKEKIDIIHSVNSAVYMGALIANRTNTKHIWHIRELMEEDHNLEFFDKKYAINLLNKADKLICISKSVENKYKKLLDNDKLKLIYNGIPIDEYSNEKIRNQKDFRILIAGNLSKTKGQKEAIEAIEILINKNIKNIKLLIAGNGSYEEALKEYVKSHKLEKYVEFLGFVNNLNDIRANTNIALVCSRNEAFGRVTVESMMSKNLVIGANTGGTIELIKDKKYGFLYKQGNSEDLAQKIEYCIKNWDKCIEIIDSAYKYSVEKFSIEKCAEQVYSVYNQIR